MTEKLTKKQREAVDNLAKAFGYESIFDFAHADEIAANAKLYTHSTYGYCKSRYELMREVTELVGLRE